MAEDSSPWSTTNSIYGATLPRLTAASMTPSVTFGRPINNSTATLLAPRVPPTWTLEQPTVRPVSREMMLASVHARGGDMRRLVPSSQRDAARGYSAMLHSVIGGPADRRRGPTSANDAWWSVGRVADVGPRSYGA